VSSLSLALLRTLTLGTFMAIVGPAAAQQTYPSKPIRLIVPFPPGGGTNTAAHLVGQKLSESWGQPVLVDNRAGASTIIGSEAVAKSAPNGYTLMLTSSTHIITSLLLSTPYDAIKDFTPVATVDITQQLLAVHPSVPANNLQEFIALAKAKPGQLNYASSGSGSPNHLAPALFEMMAGVKMQHVPYKGTGPALVDLLAGQVQLGFNVPTSFMSHIRSGKLRPIAVSGETRLQALPQVPTFSQAGLPDFEVKTWHGVLAPAGMPKEIVDKLSAEIAKIVSLPEIAEKLTSQGMDPFISTPDQFLALMKSDQARLGRVIKAANIKVDE